MRIQRLAVKTGVLGFLFAVAAFGPVSAQIPSEEVNPAIAPGGPIQETNPISLESPTQQITNAPTVAAPGPAPTSLTWLDKLFSQKLPIDVGFRLGESYSDNIYYQPKKTYDYITEISPTVTLTLGQPITLFPQLDQETIDIRSDVGNSNYLKITATPTLRLYDKNSFLDDVDEDVDAIYSHQFGKLTLSLEQSYEKLSQPTIQINAEGTLIGRDVFTTTARANYIYSDKLSTYGTFTQTWNQYNSSLYTDNTEWIADYYFLYQLFPKLSAGFGPRIGFEDIAQAPNQDFQSGLFHLYFAATGKFNLALAAGAELREYEHDSSADKVTPIVEATATYRPFDSMTIKLDGEQHRIVSNGQIGDDYTASVVSLQLRQRFFQVSYLTLEGGYEGDQYTLTNIDSNGQARDDNFYYARAGLEWTSFRGFKVDVGDEYLHDVSNFAADNFNENRITVSGSFTY